MAKINLLSEELCNRISAGEVIERPYSAVKEMVENSIDAGATEIEIYIERGGKDLIKVCDNGSGIEKDDMRAAFFAHATSKISKLEDIDHIHTLGFRGEALASICSIAKVELLSKTDGQEGNRVYCDGEYIGRVEPCSLSDRGTQITVTNFFFNTPVRYKFLKSDKKEEADITAYVTRYILGNPNLSFKYFVDGELTLQSFGGGLEEAVTQVYGATTLTNCFKIGADRNDIKISGFIGNQNYFKSNKTYQTVFLNGRYISNPVISSAISNAYSAYAMKRQYPFYILSIEMKDDEVDVNVHPNKTDVRFANSQLVYGTVYKVISGILDGSAQAAEFVVDASPDALQNENATVHLYAADFTDSKKNYDTDFSDVAGIEQFSQQKKKPEKKQILTQEEIETFENYEAPNLDLNPLTDLPVYKYYGEREGREAEPRISVYSNTVDPIVYGRRMQYENFLKAQQQMIEFRQCKYRGTIFNTYLMYEIKDEVYIIDQHAAHERLIYDKFKQKLDGTVLARQAMITPYLFKVNPEEKQFIEDNMLSIWQMGITLDPYGKTAYRVLEMPVDLPKVNVAEFIQEILANVGEMKTVTLADVLKDKIAQAACKHAVKGGEILTDEERDTLFNMLKGNMGLKCPHGRPICVKLTKTKIEEMFRRKV